MPDNPASEIPGLARSLAELRFAADLRACEHCGARDPADWRMLSYATRWRVSAGGPRCRSERVYVFHADGDLLGRRPGFLELGGPEPSTVLTPAQLAAEIKRLMPDVTLDPAVARDADFAGRDLDGATFIGCRFRGAAGLPSGTGGWQVIDADFSAAGDGSDLGGAGDLLEQLGRHYDPRMADRTIRYSTGNEHSPTDPWGRSELVVHAGGRARLDHFFSRGRPARAWTGQVGAAALGALGAALDEAGFPAVPGPGLLPPDSTVRRLVVEADGVAQQASLGWHQTPSLPGYATVFDILDGVIHQLSKEAVPYKSGQPPIVSHIKKA